MNARAPGTVSPDMEHKRDRKGRIPGIKAPANWLGLYLDALCTLSSTQMRTVQESDGRTIRGPAPTVRALRRLGVAGRRGGLPAQRRSPGPGAPCGAPWWGTE